MDVAFLSDENELTFVLIVQRVQRLGMKQCQEREEL